MAADLAGNLQVYDRVNLTVKFQYSHNCFICAVEIYADSLIVGDTLGKILIMSGYLSDGLQSNILKYEWHPHEISCLKVVGSYLYSAGEEGVVVMWHLRENRRDFLPRIGCEIRNLFVH